MVEQTLASVMQSLRKDVRGWSESKLNRHDDWKKTWGALGSHLCFGGNMDARG